MMFSAINPIKMTVCQSTAVATSAAHPGYGGGGASLKYWTATLTGKRTLWVEDDHGRFDEDDYLLYTDNAGNFFLARNEEGKQVVCITEKEATDCRNICDAEKIGARDFVEAVYLRNSFVDQWA